MRCFQCRYGRACVHVTRVAYQASDSDKERQKRFCRYRQTVTAERATATSPLGLSPRARHDAPKARKIHGSRNKAAWIGLLHGSHIIGSSWAGGVAGAWNRESTIFSSKMERYHDR